MKNKFLAVFVFALVLSAYAVFAASPYFFKGIAHVNGSLAPNGTIIEAFVPGNATTPVSSATIGEGQLAGLDPGKYVISFEADTGNTVSFKVNGIVLTAENGTSNATQTLGASQIISNFNLSINKSANAAACTFAQGCTGGFCVHSICRSASTFCGDSFCDSGESCSSDDSACSSGYACTSGCVATTTTTTTTTGGGGGGGPSLPSVTESIGSISSGETKSVQITQTPVSEISFTAAETVAGVSVTVKEVSQPSGTSAPISSDVGKVYKYIDIAPTGIEGTKLSKAKIKFKVPKAWFTSNSIDPSTAKLNRLVGTSWTKLPTVQIGADAANIIYEAETPGFSTFVITGEKAAAPPAFAACGNSIIESGEQCDTLNVGGSTCQSLGYANGILRCTNCRFDTSGCTSAAPTPVCGNNILESGEECDDQQLAGQTCITKGFSSGTLSCRSCRFDTGNCVSAQPPISPVLVAGAIILILAIIGFAIWLRPRKKPK